MINLFPDPEKKRLQKVEIERIRGIVIRALGKKSDLYQIKVMELDHCPDPDCAKIESLVILLGNEVRRLQSSSPEQNPTSADHTQERKESTRIQFRFSGRLSELTEDKMSEFLNDLKDI